jgi:hypothetical protein
MPQFARGGGGVEKVNRDGAILCEIAERFSPAKIVMVASLSKFPRLGGGRLSRLSHDAINFASHGSKDVSVACIWLDDAAQHCHFSDQTVYHLAVSRFWSLSKNRRLFETGANLRQKLQTK